MTILLAENHNIIHNGLKLLLQSEKSFVITDDALNENEILDKVSGTREIDLVIIDLEMHTIEGFALAGKVKMHNPLVKVMILTTLTNQDTILHAFAAGADGYMLKSATSDELIFSLKYLKSGKRYLCAELALNLLDQQLQLLERKSLSELKTHDFSSREIQILQLTAKGLTNGEMADRLFISKRTIEGHRQSLLTKTKCKNTAALIRFALQNELIQ